MPDSKKKQQNGLKQESNVELFDESEGVITLYGDDDKPADFIQVACVEFEGEFYALMQPKVPFEGMGDDEVIIFRLEPQDDETDLFLPVESEETLQSVFEEYLRAASDDDSEA